MAALQIYPGIIYQNFLLITWICDIIVNNIYESFENKRNLKINILKSDDMLDPDENMYNDEYDEND